ncbi:hypothetical protein IH992_31640 [Candidatus Poribacteria bacterium]|nr:hypothetical protein [Candidatus Poribacteria bacterium]
MNGIERFNIQLEKPWVWEGLAPPEDTLGELSDFEMGLRRFCFECNHCVSIEIGGEKFDIFLDPDIILILDSLPKKVSELSRGEKIQIEIPESYREIEFMPVGGEIRCTLSKFGQVAKNEHFLLERTQVLGVLRCFLNELICLAVDGGYISPEQGHEFLTQVRTNAPLSGFEHKGLPKESIDPSAVHNR